MKRLFALLVVSLLPLAPLLADEQLTYPLHSRGSEPEIYVIKLLQLALDHSPIRYHLQPTEEPMNQSRAQLSLEHNQPELQVMWP